jgi:hypothetical protein
MGEVNVLVRIEELLSDISEKRLLINKEKKEEILENLGLDLKIDKKHFYNESTNDIIEEYNSQINPKTTIKKEIDNLCNLYIYIYNL